MDISTLLHESVAENKPIIHEIHESSRAATKHIHDRLRIGAEPLDESRQQKVKV